MASSQTQSKRIEGLPLALGAHAIWGTMPVYLILVREVPPVEFVAWRILFTLPLCLAILIFRKQTREVVDAMSDRRSLLTLLGSALLIGFNWVLYVVAIQTDHVYAASLGYYILPLVMMLLGLFVLKEQLTRFQWAAVGCAALGVGLLAAGALTTLAFSLSMALSFGIYGLIRKMVKVGSLAGLTVESLLLFIPSLAIVLYFGFGEDGSAMLVRPGLSFAIALGGPMTAIPLMMFAAAARKMNYSTIGFLQFLSPTIVFLLGLVVFHEQLNPAQLGCFILIWTAMALFIWDMVKGQRKARA